MAFVAAEWVALRSYWYRFEGAGAGADVVAAAGGKEARNEADESISDCEAADGAAAWLIAGCGLPHCCVTSAGCGVGVESCCDGRAVIVAT